MHRQSSFASFLEKRGPAANGAIIGAAGATFVSPSTIGPTGANIPSKDVHARIGNSSLDSVFFAGNMSYPSVRTALDSWCPKVRLGGIVAGIGYFDGVLNGQIYGIRSAVDEVAAANGAHVCITLDSPPAWFFVKQKRRRSSEATEQKCIGVLTGYDVAQRCLAAVSSPNKAQYCARHGYRFIEETGEFDSSRVPAWSKLLFLGKHLRDHDWIFWSDADSLIMDGAVRLEQFLDEDYDLIITREDLDVGTGNVNAGQFFLRNSDWSFWFLEEVWAQTQFIGHPMEEQAAMIHLLCTQNLSRHVKILTQRSFNSYPLNYCAGDFLLHFAGFRGDYRLRQMLTAEQFSTV